MQDLPLSWHDKLRHIPGGYGAGRALYRSGRKAWWDAARVLSRRGADFGPPKGHFSAYEGVRTGQLRGRVVREGQPAPKVARDSLRAISGKLQDQIGPWPLFWSQHSNAQLVSRTLALLNASKDICFEAVYGQYGLHLDPAYHYWRLPPARRLEGNWTSTISQWSSGFYHWFFDALTRLIVLPELPPDTRILVPGRLAQYQRDTLEWLNISDRARPTSERHLQVENYYFAAPTAMTGCYDPVAVEFLRRSFLSHAQAWDAPKRFLLVRVGKSRGIANEGEVLDFFQRGKWPIINPESLSLAQQIFLFSQAEAICSVHGGALTNLVWCMPGCKVFELVPSTYLNGVFEGIAEVVGLSHHFMVCPGDAAYRAKVDVATMAKWLDQNGAYD